MSAATLRGRLPDGDAKGLAAIAADLIAEPDRLRTLVVLVDTSEITTRFDTRSRTATVRIRHVEPIVDTADLEAVDQLLRGALKRRTGGTDLPALLEQPALPFDTEEE